MNKKPPIISIRNLVTQFNHHLIHDHLNLDIYPNEIFGIVGGSGSGKSVLLGAMLGLVPLKKGSIKILEKDASSLNKIMKSQLQSHWGVLFQGGGHFSVPLQLERIFNSL